MPNTFLDILAINDSAKLELSPDQIARLILTPAQWEKVPESIKTAGLRRGDGEGVRGERRGPGSE